MDNNISPTYRPHSSPVSPQALSDKERSLKSPEEGGDRNVYQDSTTRQRVPQRGWISKIFGKGEKSQLRKANKTKDFDQTQSLQERKAEARKDPETRFQKLRKKFQQFKNLFHLPKIFSRAKKEEPKTATERGRKTYNQITKILNEGAKRQLNKYPKSVLVPWYNESSREANEIINKWAKEDQADLPLPEQRRLCSAIKDMIGHGKNFILQKPKVVAQIDAMYQQLRQDFGIEDL